MTTPEPSKLIAEMPRENWHDLIQRLERHMLHIEIAAEVEKSESWVCRLKAGIIRQPPHWEGEVLKAMDRDLAERIAAQLAQIPACIPACVSREKADQQVSV